MPLFGLSSPGVKLIMKPESVRKIAWAKKNPHAVKRSRDRYRQAHPEKEKAWGKNYRNTENGKAGMKRRGHAHYQGLRNAVLQAYGGLIPHCACCGDGHEEFLTIDHINGDGAKQRKEGIRGINFYMWLIRNNFPEGFRVLCMNCNFSLGMRGYCPHHGLGV